jgi:curved DNA-binding protein CbpA
MDLYSELGVTPQAEPEVIRAAYRVLALRFHPDRQAGSSVLAAAKMARINHAYDVLSKAESRRAYDESRRETSRRFEAPLIHTTSCHTLSRSVQPFLTTYDQRGRLHAFV